MPDDALPIGGGIFYVDSTASGATYTFYDANGNEITNQTVAGLADAMYYTINGTPTKDKFYAYCTNNGEPYGDLVYIFEGSWGNVELINVKNDGIGCGKNNSNIALNKYSSYMSTIWYHFYNELIVPAKNGCSDWYIGSKAEMEEFASSGTTAAADFDVLVKNSGAFTSVEIDKSTVWGYKNSSFQRWAALEKIYSYYALAIRSF